MENETLKMTITDEGYRNIGELFFGNVLENVKSRKGWTKGDACALIMEAVKIARYLPDDEYNAMVSRIKKRYGVIDRW